MSAAGTENEVRLFTLSTHFDNDEEIDLILRNFRNKVQKRKILFGKSFALVKLIFRVSLPHNSIREKQLLKQKHALLWKIGEVLCRLLQNITRIVSGINNCGSHQFLSPLILYRMKLCGVQKETERRDSFIGVLVTPLLIRKPLYFSVFLSRITLQILSSDLIKIHNISCNSHAFFSPSTELP